MTEDRLQIVEKDEEKAPSNAALFSATTISPSKRRLVADPKPKQDSTSRLPDSSLSSESPSDRIPMKTRELPNLSDCHGCGLRINYTNPKERLQNLDSVWRIVLLCKKCTRRVKSGQICSYCLAKVSEENHCFRCRHCERQIHKDCVLKYRSFAPWSYCRSESVFSVCIDCWVPKLLQNSTEARRRRRGAEKVITNTSSLRDSRVSEDNNGAKSLEDVVKDVKAAVEKKVAVTAKAKLNSLRRAVASKRTTERARNALDLVSKRDEVSAKRGCLGTSSSSTDSSSTTVVDDAELAFQLHRAMNSSPRILKNLCSANSTCLPGPKTGDCNGDESPNLLDSRGRCSISGCSKLEVRNNCEPNGKLDRVVLEPSDYIRPFDYGSCTDVRISRQEIRSYRRTKLKSWESQENVEREIRTYIRTKRKSRESQEKGECELKTYRRTKLKDRESKENDESSLAVSLVGKCSSVDSI